MEVLFLEKSEMLIRNFTKAIRQKSAAVFCGAGVSRPSGFVDWKLLLKPLAEEIGLDIDKETDLVSLAQFYRNESVTRAEINQSIIDAFNKDVDINENIKILTRLPIDVYWTTNYDKLLEYGLKEASRKADIKIDSDQLSITVPERDAIVYKMHGDVEHPAQAVLTKDDYELYEKKRPLFRTALKGDLISRTFLFVGFSFEDPNLEHILSQIHSLLNENVRTHYCFFRRIQKKDYDGNIEDYCYNKAKQDLREKDLKRYGIQTVFVDEYSEITEILRKIEWFVHKNSIFISGSAEVFSKPWDKNLAEDFVFKLSVKLVENNFKITSGFGLGIGSSVVNGALNEIYRSKYKHVDEYLCLRPFPQNIPNCEERTKLYRQYRKDMIAENGVAIFVFGNKKIFDENNEEKIILADGCREEFEIAKELNCLLLPVGSTGYMAKELLDELKNNIANYSYLKDYLNILECETDIDKLIDTIIIIVKSNRNFCWGNLCDKKASIF